MNVFFWVMRALPLIETLMRIVEAATGPKMGKFKSSLVIGFIKNLLITTGHMPEDPKVWAEVETHLQGIIDGTARLIFNLENKEAQIAK